MSFILGLIVGGGLGAVGHYYMQQYRANRTNLELISNKKNNAMVELFEQYPYLMNLIKSNLTAPEYRNIREFFVVDKQAIMNSSVPRLRYDLSEEVLLLLKNLEQFEYIERLEHDSLLYRMGDGFVAQLKSMENDFLEK